MYDLLSPSLDDQIQESDIESYKPDRNRVMKEKEKDILYRYRGCCQRGGEARS